MDTGADTHAGPTSSDLAGGLRARDPRVMAAFLRSWSGAVERYCRTVCEPERVVEAVEISFADFLDKVDTCPISDEHLESGLMRSTSLTAAEAARIDWDEPGAPEVSGEASFDCELTPLVMAGSPRAPASVGALAQMDKHVLACTRCQATARRLTTAKDDFSQSEAADVTGEVLAALLARFSIDRKPEPGPDPCMREAADDRPPEADRNGDLGDVPQEAPGSNAPPLSEAARTAGLGPTSGLPEPLAPEESEDAPSDPPADPETEPTETAPEGAELRAVSEAARTAGLVPRTDPPGKALSGGRTETETASEAARTAGLAPTGDLPEAPDAEASKEPSLDDFPATPETKPPEIVSEGEVPEAAGTEGPASSSLVDGRAPSAEGPELGDTSGAPVEAEPVAAALDSTAEPEPPPAREADRQPPAPSATAPVRDPEVQAELQKALGPGPAPAPAAPEPRLGAGKLAEGARARMPLRASIAVVLAAAISGLLLSLLLREDKPGPRSVAAGPLELEIPDGWTSSGSGPRIGRLDLRGPLAAEPASGGGLVAGVAPGQRALLDPTQVAEEVGGAVRPPATVRLGRLEAFRWRNLKTRNPGRNVDLIVAPTSAGAVTVACYGPSATAASAVCDRAAGGLRLTSGKGYSPTRTAEWRQGLFKAVGRLRTTSAGELSRLRRATTGREQARAASSVAKVYGLAATGFSTNRVPPLASEVNAKLVAALRDLNRAYAGLGRAADRGDLRGYESAGRSTARQEERLRQLLRSI